MKPKTPEQLREKCQRIANETGCMVTVDEDSSVYIWNFLITPNKIEYIDFWDLKSNVILDYSNPAAKIMLCDFSIKDPENWIFEPREET